MFGLNSQLPTIFEKLWYFIINSNINGNISCLASSHEMCLRLILKGEIPRQLGKIPLLGKICPKAPEQLLNVTSIRINTLLPSFIRGPTFFIYINVVHAQKTVQKQTFQRKNNNSDVSVKLNEIEERHFLGYLSMFILVQIRVVVSPLELSTDRTYSTQRYQSNCMLSENQHTVWCQKSEADKRQPRPV